MTDFESLKIKIEAQQAEVGEASPEYMIGEQLKDIASREPQAASILNNDIDIAEMNLKAAAKEFQKYVDKHKGKKDNCFCITPKVAEKILREFYHIPEPTEEKQEAASEMLDLADFM